MVLCSNSHHSIQIHRSPHSILLTLLYSVWQLIVVIPATTHHNTQYKMNFDEHEKMYNWPEISLPTHKMSHGDINKLPNHAYDDKLVKVALTDHGWKAFIKIQQFIHSLHRKTDRHHRDCKAVKLLVKDIIELNSGIKVLEEYQKGGLKESATLQGGITVDKFEEKETMSFVVHHHFLPWDPKKYFRIGGGDRWWDMKRIVGHIPHHSKPRHWWILAWHTES